MSSSPATAAAGFATRWPSPGSALGGALLGAGAVVWWTCWRTWRQAELGTPDFTPPEFLLLTSAVLLGWLVGCAADRPGRAMPALGLSAVALITAGFSLWWWAAPGRLAGAAGIWCTGVAPVLALAALAGSRRGLACTSLGGAAGLALLTTAPVQASVSQSAAGATIAVIAAALLMGRSPTTVGERFAGPVGGLATGWLGAAVALDWWSFLQADDSWSVDLPWRLMPAPVGLLAGIGLGAAWAAGRSSRAHGAGAGAALLVATVALGLRPHVPAAGTALALGLALGVRLQIVVSAGARGVAQAACGACAGLAFEAWLPPAGLPGWATPGSGFPLVIAAVLSLRQGPWAWLAAAGVAAAAFGLGVPEVPPALHHTEVARQGRGQVTWDRRRGELQFRHRGRVVETVGPGSCHLEASLLLARAVAPPSADTLLLGAGNPRLQEVLRTLRLDAVLIDQRAAWQALRQQLRCAGPVVPAQAHPRMDPGPIDAPLRQALRGRLPGFAEVVVVAEPIGADPGFATSEFQHLLRAAVGTGVCIQAIDLRHVPVVTLRGLCQAVATVHPWTLVFLIRHAVVFVSGGGNARDPSGLDLTGLDDDGRWLAHRCHLGEGDLPLACLGRLAAPALPAPCTDDALLQWWDGPGGDPAAALDEVRAALRGPTALATVRLDLRDREPKRRERAAIELGGTATEHSVLLWHERLAARLAAAEGVVWTVADGHQGAAAAAGAAAGLLHVGSPSAVLQAALGLPDRFGERVRSPAAAVACATALDPTILAALPPVLTGLPWPASARSPLEDLAQVPHGPALAAVAGGRGPAALALRRHVPTDCARSLLQAWTAGGTGSEAIDALRELADPFVVEMAAQALGRADRLPEALAIWRADLPLPPTLATLVHGDPPQRTKLLHALAGRGDRGSIDALAALLVDSERPIRLTAATALFKLVGDKIAYDPEWPESARQDAATRLRALHNRTP